MVKGCVVTACGYHTNDGCHAKAITIGDAQKAFCDTYFSTAKHAKSVTRITGVGACKMSDCSYNEDYECAAPEVMVGLENNVTKCMTYVRRA